MSLREQMIGEATALSLLEDALGSSSADQTEIVLEVGQQAVTRYANNAIHQNVSAANTRVAVRAVVGTACARTFANRLEPAALRQAIAEATEAARHLPQNDGTTPLTTYLAGPPRTGASEAPLYTENDALAAPFFFPATADLTPAIRAAWIRAIIERAEAAGFAAFGTASTSMTELAVVNSLGVRAYAATTEAFLRALVDNGEGTGYADALTRDAATFTPADLADEAITKCRMNRNQIELPPGEYAAVLEPNCVADFLRFPVRWGMGALAVEQGTSFMAGRFGQPVTGAQVTIWDDPRDPDCIPVPIDYEGHPTQRIPLITDGIARDVATDTATASRQTPPAASNGHATSPWETEDPVPEHIVMPGGTATSDDLTRNLARGLRISRLHYTHIPDAKQVIATGTTRDGTFLVENGEIVAAVKNLRFTQSVLDLLAGIEEVGRRKTCRDWWAANGMESTYYYVPALRVARCVFTGVTTF
jgi:PmbA protein